MTDGFQQVVERSGLTRMELAKLYGVSRQTIHYWRVVGPPRENGYTARMARTITQALLTAISRRLLPLASLDKKQRKEKIAGMARTLQALKPAPIK